MASRRDPPRHWAPFYDCLLVYAWAQTVLGYLLPTLLIDFWQQAALSAARQRRRAPSSVARMLPEEVRPLGYVGLLALASVLTYWWAELVVVAAHRHAGQLGLAALAQAASPPGHAVFFPVL